ncbi:MAG: GNAT family N-acetyltransferase [Acidobacteriota bacterium]
MGESGHRIRRAVDDDLSALGDVDPAVRRGSDRTAFLRDAVRDHRAWVVEGAGGVIGYGVISHGFFGRSFIELVYVAEAHRSSGYGPQMVTFLEGQSRSNDVFTSTNASNSHMQHVLEKLGYERAGVIHHLDPGDPELVYVKRGVL